MPSRSAPSAKIFDAQVGRRFMRSPADRRRIQSAASASERDAHVRRRRAAFIVAVVDEDRRPAAGAPAGLDVAPAVADHDAAAQVVDAAAPRRAGRASACGTRSHRRRRGSRRGTRRAAAARPGASWMASTASRRLASRARRRAGWSRRPARSPPPCSRASASATPGRISSSSTRRRRIRLAVAHDGPVDHAVAIEEHRAAGFTASTPTSSAPP